MAHTKSALKGVRQGKKRRLQNHAVKSDLKTRIKSFQSLLASGEVEKAQGALKDVTARLSRAAARHRIHKNTASRKVSRLTKRLTKQLAGQTAA